MSLCKHLIRSFSSLGNISIFSFRSSLQNGFRVPSNKCHTTPEVSGLMEFFDKKEHWGKESVKVGRSWRLDELRIKSNSDLHKLWYILLKEKNMLLTLEHECKEKFVAMPNAERIDKVAESMKNLETVVRERNKAYFELEVGETGERRVVSEINCFGLPTKRKLREYYIEEKYNYAFKNMYRYLYQIMNHQDVILFLRKYREKQYNRRLSIIKHKFKHVCGLFRRFEGMDEEALKEAFPEVDIEKAKMHKDSRGPRVNMF